MNELSASSAGPRVALLGMALEANAFAPISTEADFRARGYLEGETILDEARAPTSTIAMEMTGFVRGMDATGAWQPVPVVLASCEPGGPVDHEFFVRTVDTMVERLRAAAPLDAIYVANHGAMTSTGASDADGAMLLRLREAVGEAVVMVMTLDLHANLSHEMVNSCNVIIGYLTNPHVDMLERGEEAALTTRLALAGARPRVAFSRLPLTPASVSLLTAEAPYGRLMDLAQRRKHEHGGAILNASVFGGFVFSDTPENGLALVVTARDDIVIAQRLADELAAHAWSERALYRKALTDLDEAVALAVAVGQDASREAVIFSDAGDNPGGGGRGNTTELLGALLEAGACGVLYGSFFDPDLARETHQHGEGARFEAVFNRAGETQSSRTLSAPARVVALGNGQVVGRRGIYAGRELALGPVCALALGEAESIVVVVISARLQTADPMFFEQLSLDVSAARTVCVKSRGHFRAGFDEWFAPHQVYEADTVGLTSPVLERFTWKGLPRPVYPLDEDARWEGR